MTSLGDATRRKALVVGGVGAMLLIAVIFAPDPDIAEAEARLTTYSREPSGARGFYETAARLGWRVTRHEIATLPPASRSVVYASLAPGTPLTAVETHELLERVRAGAALFVVLSGRSPLSDSLGVRFQSRFGRVPDDAAAVCDVTRRERAADLLRGAIYSTSIELRSREATRLQTFLELDRGGDPRTRLVAAAGFQLGEGRIGVVADPDLLTNAALRMCRLRAGVSAVQLLEFVSSDTSGARVRNVVVFDEYRHGHGEQPSLVRISRRFVSEHPFGRTLGHVSIAGIILLAAVGSRPSPPAPPERPSRRSPLEHARALSLAYSQVSATRRVTRLLVRGLRRRLRLTGRQDSRNPDDEEFLAYIADRFPTVATDAARIAHALQNPIRKSELAAVGRSTANIERTIASANQ